MTLKKQNIQNRVGHLGTAYVVEEEQFITGELLQTNGIKNKKLKCVRETNNEYNKTFNRKMSDENIEDNIGKTSFCFQI